MGELGIQRLNEPATSGLPYCLSIQVGENAKCLADFCQPVNALTIKAFKKKGVATILRFIGVHAWKCDKTQWYY